jgi:hypothetical protein
MGEKNPFFFLGLGQEVTDRDRGGVRRRCNRGDREWGRRRASSRCDWLRRGSYERERGGSPLVREGERRNPRQRERQDRIERRRERGRRRGMNARGQGEREKE